MAQSETSRPRTRRWLKILAWVVGIFVVLIVALYFIGTSSAFLTGFVLPRVGRSMNAEVTVSSADISPFSHVILHDLKVTPKGAETIFSAASVTARYNLKAILGGNILVDEVSIVSPTVTLVENADGTSNLTPLQPAEAASTPAPKTTPPAKPAPSAPPQLDIKSVRLENAVIRHVTNLKGGGREVIELSPVNLTIANVKNGATGQMDLSAAIAVDKSASTLQAKLDGSFSFALTPDLKPGPVKGAFTVSIDKGTGDFAGLAALGAKLDCDVTPAEIKQFSLAFTKAGVSQGTLLVSGPFDSAKMEGKLKVEIRSIDRQVLNLAGAASGIDFGTTTINTSNEIELTKGGTFITAVGSLDVGRMQVVRQKQSSPTLDLRCEYSVAVDQQAQSMVVKSLNLLGKQNDRRLLKIDLSDPMTVGWGNQSNAGGDSTLTLALTGLNLADWKPLAGDAIPSGKANLKLKVRSQQGGQQLTIDLDGGIDRLTARAGENQLPPLDVSLKLQAQVAELQKVNLSNLQLDVTEKNQPVVTIAGSGTVDQKTQDADLQLSVTAALARLAALVPQADFTCRAGQLSVTSHLTQKGPAQSVEGKLALTDFTGVANGTSLDHFGVQIDLDLLLQEKLLTIHKIDGLLREGGVDGGRFAMSGNYQLDKSTGQVDLKLTDFKENDLRPFLQSALGDKKLVSVTINTTASAGLSATGDASVKADLHVANLVVEDPANHLPAQPLEARLQVDASANHQVLTMRQFQFGLTPTARAKNEIQLTGTVDYSKTNAITGNLKLASTGLDLTSYYDLFAGTNNTAATTAPAPEPAKPSGPQAPPANNAVTEAKEPDPVNLPVRDFTFAAAIDRCYLREVDIKNFLMTVKIDGGHIVLNPFQLDLNGAPMTATVDADLGVPGYKYDVTFKGDKVPLAPLVDSFSPTYSDKAKGQLIASLQVQGAGITGSSLRQSLNGKATVIVTNADIQVAGGIAKTILSAISVTLGAPEVLQAPLDYADLHLRLGRGNIDDDFSARSSAFKADSTGTIPMKNVLNDSPLDQPINIYLSKELFHRLHPNTPSEGGYSKVGPLVRIVGTLGNPDYRTIVVEALATAGKAVGKAASTVKDTVGKLFGGSNSGTNSNSSTNSFSFKSLFGH